MNKDELIACAQAKSDQVDADDLIGGITLDVTIKAVQRGPSNEQPLQLVLEETEKFYRPSKTYRRALIGCFSDEPANWIGKRLRLVRNPETMFGGVKVGGIEVSHASIEAPVVLMLAAKRGKKTAVRIDVMPAATKQAQKAAVATPVAAAPNTTIQPQDFTAAINSIASAESIASLQELFTAAKESAKGNDKALKEIIAAKDKRKTELTPVQKAARGTISGDPLEGDLSDLSGVGLSEEI